MSEPLCECGHAAADHVKGALMCDIWTKGVDCPCRQFRSAKNSPSGVPVLAVDFSRFIPEPAPHHNED